MFSTHLNQPALQRWKEHSRPHYGGMRMRLTFSLLYILLYNSTSYGTAQQNGLTDICTRDLTLSHITCKQYRSHHVTWRRQLIRVSRFVMTIISGLGYFKPLTYSIKTNSLYLYIPFLPVINWSIIFHSNRVLYYFIDKRL